MRARPHLNRLLRRLLWPGIATLVVFLVLVGLGTWQVQRLAWKTALLERFEAVEAGPAVPLGSQVEAWEKVFVTGRFVPSLGALVNLEVRDNVLGSHLVMPLRRADGPPILVDRGWVPLVGGPTVHTPRGEVSLTGYISPGEKAGMFAASDDLSSRRFYTMDPMAIGKGLGLTQFEPYIFVVLDPKAQELPLPAAHLPRPSNNHLGYVLTWYGLALGVLGVFGAWAWQQRR